MTSAGYGFAGAGKLAADALRPVVDFIYPPRCPACGANIGAQTGLCLECWNALQLPDEDSGDRGRTGRIVAATTYCEVSRKLILAFKHGGKIALAPLLARLIATRLGEPREDRLIVPVPLHPLRLWRRGYNQSALLAGELERLGHGRLLVDGLRRVKPTPSLDRRTRTERAALLEDAIRIHPRRMAAVRDRDILLVDDVLTSGATSDACVVALRKADAAQITFACFARVTTDRDEGRKALTMLKPTADPGKTNARDHAIPGVT